MARAIQSFEVSLKAFIVRAGRALLVRESDTGYWELPGGRIDVGEEWLPHAGVLAREIAEELGPDLNLDISAAAVTWVRRRPTDGVYQLIIGRPCRLIDGAPVLSDEHGEMVWADREHAAGLGFPPLSTYPAALDELWRLAGRLWPGDGTDARRCRP